MFTDRQLLEVIPAVNRYAHKLCRQEGEDLVNAAVLRALEKRHLFVDDGRPKSFERWLMTITRNTYVNILREEKRKGHVNIRALDFEVLLVPSLEVDPDVRLIAKEVSSALMALDKRFRDCLNLYVEGYTYDQISEALAIPIGTVRSRIFRAKEQLTSAFA